MWEEVVAMRLGSGGCILRSGASILSFFHQNMWKIWLLGGARFDPLRHLARAQAAWAVQRHPWGAQ